MSDESHSDPKEFLSWAKLGDIPCQPNKLTAEMLKELKVWIDSGEVLVDSETKKYFHLIGKYPIGINRIDWRGVREHLTHDVLPVRKGATASVELEEKLTDCRNTLLDWFTSSGISLHESIVWIGDDSDVSLHMTIETLLRLYPILFPWPQHHYVLPPTGEWCLNYTMEGQIFFGKLQSAIAHGCVDLDCSER